MGILLTGATGLIGRAVLDRFRAAGYEVTALVSSAEDAAAVRAAGATPFLGDEDDQSTLSQLALDSDGVIHTTASEHDDPGFVDAVLHGIEGGVKPLVYTSSLWAYGANPDITEGSPLAPPAAVDWLVALHRRLIAEADVNVSIIAPGIAYGHGEGIPRQILCDALDRSGAEAVLPLVGDGSQHWATVHVDDLAELYLHVFERTGFDNEVYLGVDESDATLAELASAAASAAGCPDAPRAETADATRARLGAGLADVLLLDQHARADKAREAFGWHTTRPSLLEELRAGYTGDTTT